MDLNSLIEVLEIPTLFKREERMVDYLIGWGAKNHVPVILDVYGNVYLKKGKIAEGEYFPCVIAHMDTVQYHEALVDANVKLKITEKYLDGKTILSALNPLKTGVHAITGVGGDDKAGVAICLDIISKTDNIIGAFFKSEEIGCLGAKHVDKDIMKDVGYAIEFDAPSADWLSYVSYGTQLFDREFFKLVDSILLRHGISNIRASDPFTDIYLIKQKFDFNCMNFFAGYYYPHSLSDCVVYEDALKAATMGYEIIQKLGTKKYVFKYKRSVTPLDKILFD